MATGHCAASSRLALSMQAVWKPYGETERHPAAACWLAGWLQAAPQEDSHVAALSLTHSHTHHRELTFLRSRGRWARSRAPEQTCVWFLLAQWLPSDRGALTAQSAEEGESGNEDYWPLIPASQHQREAGRRKMPGSVPAEKMSSAGQTGTAGSANWTCCGLSVLSS